MLRSTEAGQRLDFRRGQGGSRRAVSDAIAAIGWDEGEAGYVLLRVERQSGKVELHQVELREARRLLEETIVRYGDEVSAQDAQIGRQTAAGRWELIAYCTDGRLRVFRAKDHVVHPERAALSPDVRFDVLARDRFTCRYCGRSAPAVALQVDHIVPVARGGTSDPGNLVTACVECNAGKRDKLMAAK